MRSLKAIILAAVLFTAFQGKSFAQFSGGTGTGADPYQIANVADLKALSALVANDPSKETGAATAGKYWKLVNDIDMAGVTDFVPIGGWKDAETNAYTCFEGVFDGNGMKIKNLTINKPGKYYVALFGTAGKHPNYGVSSAELKNLGIENGTFTGSFVAGLAEECYAKSVSNCYVTGSITVSGVVNDQVIAGGLIASTTAEISNCHSSVTINATGITASYKGYIGGLTGKIQDANVTDCYTTAPITVTACSFYELYLGGLIGQADVSNPFTHSSKISFCYSTSDVTCDVKNVYLGGLTGSGSEINVSYCYATGNIAYTGSGGGTNYSMIGGLIGSYGGSSVYVSKLQNSYTALKGFSAGGTSTSTEKGLFLGNDKYSGSAYASANNCYYAAVVPGFETSALAGVMPLSPDEMKTPEFASVLNTALPFVWQYNPGGYPVFSTQQISGAVTPDIAAKVDSIFDFGAFHVKVAATIVPNTGIAITESGVEWKEKTASAWNAVATAGNLFPATVSGLSPLTQYDLRLYVKTASAVYYGMTHSFKTPAWEGTGAADNPFQIYTVADLKALSDLVMNDQSAVITSANTSGKYWKLMNDIDMTGVTDFIPIGGWSSAATSDGNKMFAGVFDGDGKKIKNLIINLPGKSYVALFGKTGSAGTSAAVKNLGIENCSIIGGLYTGSLAAYTYGGSISNCYATGAVTVFGTSSAYVGGLAGYCAPCGFTNCYTNVSLSVSGLSSSVFIGGMTGDAERSSFSRCFSAGSITVNNLTYYNNTTGGLIGTLYGGFVSNCYSTVGITIADCNTPVVGGLIGISTTSTVKNSYTALSGFSITPSNTNSAGLFSGKANTPYPANCYYATTVSGYDTSNTAGVAPLDPGVMKTLEFASTLNTAVPFVWQYNPGGYPVFDWQQITGAVTPDIAAKVDTIYDIDAVHAFVKATIIPNGTAITERGIEWKPKSSATWNAVQASADQFTVTIEGLSPLTPYNIRTYAKTASATRYGIVQNFTSGAWQGYGTADLPYQISTVFDLKALSDWVMNGSPTIGKYWKLMNDIDMTGVTDFIPIGGWSSPTTNDGAKYFEGFFDGNAKKIKNLTINQPDMTYVGLFGIISQTSNYEKAALKNLGVENAVITGGNIVGIMVGDNWAAISGCYATGSVTFSGVTNSTGGGFVGRAIHRVTNCYMTGSVAAVNQQENHSIGGFAGYTETVMSNCYAVIANFSDNSASISKGLFAGAINGYATITNCYYATTVSGFEKSNHAGIIPLDASAMKTPEFVQSLNMQTPFVWQYSAGAYPPLDWQAVAGAAASKVGVSLYTITKIEANRIDVTGTFTPAAETVTEKGVAWKPVKETVWKTLPLADSVFATTITGLTDTTDYEIRPYIKTAAAVYYGVTRYFATTDWIGLGTTDRPYQILKPADLKRLSLMVQNGQTTAGIYWMVMNDIDMTGVADYTPIGGRNAANQLDLTKSFAGSFDGNNKKIINLTLTQSCSGRDTLLTGLFGYITGGWYPDAGVVKSLGIENSSITCLGGDTAVSMVGSIAAWCPDGNIVNCYSTATVTGNNCLNVGGIIGKGNMSAVGTLIKNTRFAGKVLADKSINIGGIAGEITNEYTNITSCYSSGTITSTNTIALTKETGAGGGQFMGVTKFTAGGGVGGIVGTQHWYSNVSNSYSSAVITASGPYVSAGGITGFMNMANMWENVSDAVITGNGVNARIGGVIGECWASGGVSDNRTLNCYSRATISVNGDDALVGGFLGAKTGGIYFPYHIYRCYSAPRSMTVAGGGSPKAGAFMGYYTGTLAVENDYFSTALDKPGLAFSEATGYPAIIGAPQYVLIGKTEDEMKQAAFVDTLNLNQSPTVWRLDAAPLNNDGLPVLLWKLKSASLFAITEYPYLQPFDSDLAAYWVTSEAILGSNRHWAPTTGINYIKPEAGSYYAFLNGGFDPGYNPYYLTTLSFVLGSTPKQLSYYYYIGNSNWMPTSLVLQISADNGATWTDLYSHSQSNTNYIQATTEKNPWSSNTIDLTPYADKTVIFRFVGYSASEPFGSADVAIDEFLIENKMETDIETVGHEEKALSLYPNPVHDVLHIGGLTGAVTVKVVDFSGRIVFTKQNVIESVDVSSLPAGIYLLQINANGETMVKKFIKK